MRCANSYQDIKGPDELEEERIYEHELEAMLDEFDPEEAEANGCSFQTFRQNCIRTLNAKRKERYEND